VFGSRPGAAGWTGVRGSVGLTVLNGCMSPGGLQRGCHRAGAKDAARALGEELRRFSASNSVRRNARGACRDELRRGPRLPRWRCHARFRGMRTRRATGMMGDGYERYESCSARTDDCCLKRRRCSRCLTLIGPAEWS
jgi:hypothetical protein